MDEQYTVAGILRHHAAERPDATMLVDGTERRTWIDQLRRSAQVAAALASEGVGAGDRVAFLDRNGAPFFDLLFGTALMGAVLVPVNWRLAPPEVVGVIDDAEAAVFVAHEESLAGWPPTGGTLPSVRRIVVLGPSAAEADPPDPRRVAYEPWLAGRSTDDPGHAPGSEDISLLLYTSGTTGRPKGVMLTNHNVAFACGAANRSFEITDRTVSLAAMPLFHIGGVGWALAGMSRGGRTVVLRDVDPGQFLALVAAEGVTATFVVPAVLLFLTLTPAVATTDFSSLETIFYGASPIGEDLLEQCLTTFGCQFSQLYGLTETTGAFCALRPEDHDPEGPRRYLLRSAGRPFDWVELRAVDPDTGQERPVGEVGEVWTRSEYNMAGYWHQPEETARAVTPDGWFKTGDAGYVDADGYLFLQDRIKDMIVSGGENIYPAEVENALSSHPGVIDAAVIGVPDDRWGETVKAIVVRAPGADVGADDLIAWCRERLAHYKCPTSVDFVDRLPRNPTGKILKQQLRDPYWQGRQRNI